MNQSEMGAARCNDSGTFPRKGFRIREFELLSRDGLAIRLSDFRGHCNLVLLFLGTADELTLVFASEIANRSSEFEQRGARVIMAFTAASRNVTRIPMANSLVVLTDLDGAVHRAMGATEDGRPTEACYITDRFGEVYAAFRMRDGNLIPTVDEMLGWLDFIEAQCPECEPPEWPADAA